MKILINSLALGRILALAAGCACSGCVTVSSGPDRGFDPNAEAVNVINAYRNPNGAQLSNNIDRNNFIAARMYAQDLEYSTYFEKLLKV